MSDGPQAIAVPPTSKPEAAEEAARTLRAGGLIIMPTDTVYGLAADLHNAEAVRDLYEAKGRPREMPVPVLVATAADANRHSRAPASARGLMERFWPGALTVVVPRSRRVPDAVTGGRETVGLRVPESNVARAVIEAAGGALAVTSANISGQSPACEMSELTDEVLARVSLVIDAGRCPGGVASTVVDVSVSPPRVLRVGAIAPEALRALLPELVVAEVSD